MDNQPENKKKLIRLVLPLVGLIIVLSLVLVYTGVVKAPSTPIPFLQKKVTVELKTEYKNPFKKEAQYVNPFETYKNPFTVAK